MCYFKLVTFSALLVTTVTFCPPMICKDQTQGELGWDWPNTEYSYITQSPLQAYFYNTSMSSKFCEKSVADFELRCNTVIALHRIPIIRCPLIWIMWTKKDCRIYGPDNMALISFTYNKLFFVNCQVSLLKNKSFMIGNPQPLKRAFD